MNIDYGQGSISIFGDDDIIRKIPAELAPISVQKELPGLEINDGDEDDDADEVLQAASMQVIGEKRKKISADGQGNQPAQRRPTTYPRPEP